MGNVRGEGERPRISIAALANRTDHTVVRRDRLPRATAESETVRQQIKTVLTTGTEADRYAYPELGDDRKTSPGLWNFFMETNRGVPIWLVQKHRDNGWYLGYIQGQVARLPQENDLRQEMEGILQSGELTPAQQSEELWECMHELSERYVFQTPGWLRNAEVYHIIPDRFFNPDLVSPDPQVRERAQEQWTSLQGKNVRDFEDNNRFAGGTLQGVEMMADLLKAEGYDTLYSAPVFLRKNTIHGYNADNFFVVDPRLLGRPYEEFAQARGAGDTHTIAAIEAQGILHMAQLARTFNWVQDIAVNHTGLGFLEELQQRGENPYAWYQTENGQIKKWWGFGDLPELNHFHQGVAEYFLGKAYVRRNDSQEAMEEWKQWTRFGKQLLDHPEQLAQLVTHTEALHRVQEALGVFGFWTAVGVKGWRLDVPNEVKRQVFWEEVTQATRAINPDTATMPGFIAECWDHEDDAYWTDGKKHDGVMNYRDWQAVQNFLVGAEGRGMEHMSRSTAERRAYFANSSEYARAVGDSLSRHPYNVAESMLSMSGNHDVPRRADAIPHPQARHISYVLQWTLPGAHSVYYGDEIDMHTAGAQSVLDPLNRQPYHWNIAAQPDGTFRAEMPDTDTRWTLRTLRQLRKEHPALRSAKTEFIPTDNGEVVMYARKEKRHGGDDKVVVIANKSSRSQQIAFPLSSALDWGQLEIMDVDRNTTYAWEDLHVTVHNDRVHMDIPEFAALVLATPSD